MRRLLAFTVALAISSGGVAQVAEPGRPQTVEISSGGVRLTGFLWRPAGRGPFPAVVFNHGRSDTPPRWTVENRQFVDRPKAAISSAETSEFYFVPSSVRKSVCTFVRQLRGPHLSTCA